MKTGDSSERLCLRDIMLRRYLRLGEEHTLAEVMGFLSDERFKQDGLPYLVVIARDGSFAGMLAPKSIFKALVGDGVPESGQEQAFLEKAAQKLGIRTGEIMDRSMPVLSPDEPLESAFACFQKTATDVLVLVEDRRVVGLVTARILFETASSLTVGALSGGVIPPGAPARE